MTATASITQTRTVNTSELQVGDIVWTYGIRVRIEHVTTYDDRGPVWSATGTVLNPDEVKAAGLVPPSFLYCYARTEAVRPEVREAHATSHDHGECWSIQGNELARWTVEVAAERQTNSWHVAWQWLTAQMSDRAARQLLDTAVAKGEAADRCNRITYSTEDGIFRLAQV